MKITSKIFAGVFAAAVVSTAAVASVGAADYYLNADDSKPKAGAELDVSAVVKETTKDKLYYVNLTGIGEATKLNKYVIDALNDAGLDVFLNDLTAKGVTGTKKYDVAIPASEIGKLYSKYGSSSFDFGVGITVTDDEYPLVAGKTVTGVDIAEGSYVIKPIATKEFGFSFDITFAIPNKNFKYLYYISDNGEIQDASKALLTVDSSDLTATITLSHASAYILTDTEIEDAVTYKAPTSSSTGNSSNTNSGNNSGSGNGGTDNPNTGVALPVALVALAGGSVAVSAIVAKKRK